MNTLQIERWRGEFGREYTDRNSLDRMQLDELYRGNYGVARSELNDRFLADIPKDARILEVGCNRGGQLLLLREMGFRNVFGIEIQHYALTQARALLPGVPLLEATAFEIPFATGSFDLVFTSGVLIHIAPDQISKAISEIHRCSTRYIWGLEYHAATVTEVSYRGRSGLLWKADYLRHYLEAFDDLEVVKQESLPYLNKINKDCMFLLQKRRSGSRFAGRQEA